MKKELKRVEINPIGFDMETSHGIPLFGCGNIETYIKYEYKFSASKFIDMNNAQLFEVVEVPETIGEWVKQAGISKNELLDWLNKHYNPNL